MGEEKKLENTGDNRKGSIIQLSGTAYIKAGAFLKKQDPEIQAKIDEIIRQFEEKKRKEKCQ
jgi:hypothetical protein